MNKLFIVSKVVTTTACIGLGIATGIAVGSALAMGTVAKVAVGYVAGAAVARITNNVCDIAIIAAASQVEIIKE